MLVVPLSKLNNKYGSWLPRLLIERLKSIDQGANLCFEGQNRNPMRSYYSSNWINQYPINTISRNSMASKTIYGDVCIERLFSGCGNGGVFFGNRSYGKARVSFRNGGGGSVVCVPDLGLASRRLDSRLKPKLIDGQCGRRYRASMSASCSDGGTAADTFNVRDVAIDNSDCKQGDKRTLKLHSGVCYLPHPDKIATGGEDAHFICEEKRVIGVADGVGGWADVGVDAGIYSRLLMSNSMQAIVDVSENGEIDPAKVLEKAHSETNVIGSSTACIIALTDQGIHAINLGDSGFIVIRDGSTVFRSPSQQYGFNFPYQLANGSGGDLPSSGQVFTFPVESGDIIVAGTDGLFDNLYDNEISALVVQAKRSGSDPQTTAQNIATLAQHRALDQQRKTPFAAAAHDAGFRYFGGKLDDITVVVSYITGDE